MPKKKTTYEPKGFVRRMMKGGIFSSKRGMKDELLNKPALSSTLPNEEKKWRPRKKQFELLEGNDDDSLSAAFHSDYTPSWNIKKTFSTESETGDYKREIIYDQKTDALKKHQESIFISNDRKREFSPIKPPVKDTIVIRAPTSSAKKIPKKQRRELNCQEELLVDRENGTSDDPFSISNVAADSSHFHQTNDRGNSNNTSIRRDVVGDGKASCILRHDDDSIVSRQTSSSKQTYPYSSYATVSSDPTDFFSKEQTTKLTMNNLARMATNVDSSRMESEAKKGNDGFENPMKERKFYQFAVDEDKASTVVESSIQLPAQYDTDEDEEQTEYSCGQTSQGTKIQQGPGAPKSEKYNDGDSSFFLQKQKIEKETEKLVEDTVPCSDPKKEEFNSFFSENDNDDFFPAFSRTEKSQSVDISFDDPFLPQQESNRLQSTQIRQSRQERQVSTKSLSYSVSPEHNKKTTVVQKNAQQCHKNRLPLTIEDSKHHGNINRKSLNSGQVFPLPHLNRSTASGNYRMEKENAKLFRKKDANFQFDAFAQPKAFSEVIESERKIRDSSSTSSNFQPLPANHFGSSPPRNNTHGNNTTNMQDKESVKENFVVKTNQVYRYEAPDDTQGMNNQKKLPIREGTSYGDNDDNDDDDSFDSIALWERPSGVCKGIRSQNFLSQSTKTLADSNDDKNTNPYGNFKNDNSFRSSHNCPNNRKLYHSDVNDDDNVSETVSSMSGSYTKTLALPSNAIMASMLFRTHYDTDKNDVEEKLKAHEEEQKETRHYRGDIPDAVTADHDYMSTVSSFSEGTSAYLQETWRKPSRDLLNYLSSARTLDLNYSSTKRSQQIKRLQQVKQNEGLFEA